MEKYKLKIESLSAAYGDQMVILEICLEVAPGEILALIGPNGAGKTSLIRVLSGLLAAKAGRVTVSGKDLLHMPVRERALVLAVVPQARQLGGAYTVEQAVMMGRTAHMGWLGRDGAADRQAVQRALEQTSLVDFAQRHIASLSGGEQQRVLLARALAQSTPVLLLDEPTNHLDIPAREALQEVLEGYSGTILMVTHDRFLINQLANQIWEIRAGRLEAFNGTYREYVLRAASRNSSAPARQLLLTAKPLARDNSKQTRRRMETLELVESRIREQEQALKRLSADLQKAGGSHFERVQELGWQVAKAQARLEELMQEWETLAV
jgi:iron complex transport system ATP-binding protein